MADAKSQTSRLFLMTIMDMKEDLDEKLERCHTLLCGITKDLSEREANEALQAHICKGPAQHDDIQLGFLYSILSDPKSAGKNYRDMSILSQDGLNKVMAVASQLIFEKWTKLNDTCRTQITWLAKELVHNGVARAEGVCHQLVRQIAGGDLTPKNIWLTETVLDIFTENRSWLDKVPMFLPLTLYTYLRVIVDHGGPQLANLRQREVEFCVSLMREKWLECQQIGRDLVRLLQGVARIPEFNSLWKDLLMNPSSLNPQFTGVKQLLQMKTSRSYFISRLTPDMENKLNFLTSQVRFGQQKRYQDWFQRQYLSTPESQSLRCDLIRFICAVIHPSNEVLCSDIIPRWAVIGWLLTTCTSNVAASNAKLALFYDWLFFDPEKDNIMNIEPCILVMFHSMRPHPAITATLLDFMCRIMSNFYPPLTTLVRQGIFASLRTIIDKRVLQSLAPLFDNQKLDKELYTMLRENFAEFCSTESSIKEEAVVANNKDIVAVEPSNHVALENNNISDIAEFSDEDDAPLGKLVKEPKVPAFKMIREVQPINIQTHLDQLDSDLRSYVVELRDETDKETQCELMDRLMQLIIREEFDQEDATALAACLCQILATYFEGNLLPQELDDESVEDSIGSPMFVIFRNICQTPEEDQSRQTMMMLLEEMYKKQPSVGYHFLYFLKVSKVQNDEKMSSYKDFCKNMEQQSIEAYLMADLRLCQEDDVRLFVFLVPDIYSQFPSIAVGNVDLIHLIVSCIDGTQLQDLICEILQGHLVMFGSKESFLSVLNASLQWETIEQYFLWQLISVHTIPVEHIMPILPKLDFTVNAEALSSIMILLKQDCPSAELLRPLLCRECKKNDLFTVSLLKYWAQEYEDRLADLLHTQLTKSNGTPSKKRHRNQPQPVMSSKLKDQPTTEQILAHLDHMRLTCRNISFLTNEIIQQALQFVQTSCSEALKAKYGDLLALVEDFEEMKSTRVLRQVPSRRASQAATKSANSGKMGKKTNVEDSDSSSECTDDEDQLPKSKKMKRFTVDD